MSTLPILKDESPSVPMGRELRDLDLRTLTAEQARSVRGLVYKHKMIAFRDQKLTNAEYVGLSRILGTPQIYFQPNYLHPDHPEIFVSSNVPENGKKVGVAGTGRYWHTDYQFFPQPLPMTLLYPQVLPSHKRETSYIDLARVYRNLPAELRQLVDGRMAIHDAKYRYKVTPEDVDRAIIDLMAEFEALAPPTSHPSVIEHPVTGEKILYMSRGFTTGLSGYTYEQNQEILPRLFDFIERPEHVYTHTWQHGDVLLWDNRSLLHRAGDTPKGEKSASYRIGIYDGVPFYVGLEASDGTDGSR